MLNQDSRSPSPLDNHNELPDRILPNIVKGGVGHAARESTERNGMKYLSLEEIVRRSVMRDPPQQQGRTSPIVKANFNQKMARLRTIKDG
jgi:hypothetical protein